MAWPNLFIVGAEKAATTSLHAYLDQHPQIFMARDKEPGFFSTVLDDADDAEAARRRYLALFEGADEPIRGEASTSYLWHPRAPERIHDRVPDARHVVSVRDPVERAWSHYRMVVRANREDRPPLEALRQDRRLCEADGPAAGERYILSGFYVDKIARYVDRFGEDQVLPVLVDDLRGDPAGTLGRIVSFLDVDPEGVDAVEWATRHHEHKRPPNRLAGWLRSSPTVTGVARRVLPKSVRDWLGNEVLLESADKPAMPEDVRAWLVSTYREEAERLEELLGRELPWEWI